MTAMCRCGLEAFRPDTVTGRRQALRCSACHRTTGRCECPIDPPFCRCPELSPEYHPFSWHKRDLPFVSRGDLDRAIAIVQDSRTSHVHWRDWRLAGHGTDEDHEMVGDLAYHEGAIADYDHVLRVLGAARRERVDPEPRIDEPKPTHPWNDPDDDGHDCADCPDVSMWKCDRWAHPMYRTDHNHESGRTPRHHDDCPACVENRAIQARQDRGERHERVDPCCYSLHEFENVCPRTGQNFTWNAPPHERVDPDLRGRLIAAIQQMTQEEPGTLAWADQENDPAKIAYVVDAILERWRSSALSIAAAEAPREPETWAERHGWPKGSIRDEWNSLAAVGEDREA